ncbi:hypothetical protein ASD23_09895 [Agromyces sp. Root1464]|uniref:hypothetical protein n=1 Tax=Agromyces sp. Root1464 TaxID=1736467 RepID=UPI0006F62334|nr:hypothetical protein [Agromyces sp. Root1464]KQZ08693.1 hypothetical protein ASD23_09895 [Agromyces sp. Root1464]
MTDFVDPLEEPLDLDRDPDAPFDPDLDDDLIDSAEADRAATTDDSDDTLGDTAPLERLE